MARVNTGILAGAGLLLLGAGFGLGLLLGGERAPTVVYGDRPVEETRPPATEPPRGPGPAAPLPPKAPPPPSGPPVSEADREAVRAALRALPAVPVPEGSGVLRGRVLLEDGSPLPGVEVTLQPEPPEGLFGKRVSWDEEPDLETVLADSVRRTRWWREARQRTSTDAAGAFRFDGVIDTANRVSARAKGWEIRPRDSNAAWRARPGGEVEFVAGPVVEVAVEVSLSDGSVPRQAMVNFATGSGSHGHGWSPENPTVRMKPGTYQVSASSGDQQEWRSDGVAVALEAGLEPPPLRFVLRGRPGIRGKVVLEGFQPEGNVMVRVGRVPAEGSAGPELLDGSTARNTWAHANNGFAFSFQDLPPGRYLVGVSLTHRGKVLQAEEVEVAGDTVTRDLRVAALDPEDFLLVRALGPDGSPVGGVRFSTGYRDRNSSSSGGGTALRRTDGTWVVPHQEVDRPKEDGIWWVEATSPATGTKRVEYVRGQAREVTLRFEEPGSVEVAVTGLRGTALEGLLHAFLSPAETEGARHVNFGNQQRLDAEGRTFFLGVQPGEYRVLLTAGENQMRAIARVPLAVRAGKNVATVAVPTLHAVTVTGAEGSAWIRKADDRWWNDSRKADAEGRVVFDGLPEGEYKVGSGQKSQDFRVPGTAEVRL